MTCGRKRSIQRVIDGIGSFYGAVGSKRHPEKCLLLGGQAWDTAFFLVVDHMFINGNIKAMGDWTRVRQLEY